MPARGHVDSSFRLTLTFSDPHITAPAAFSAAETLAE
jgi:hypothetical protein